MPQALLDPLSNQWQIALLALIVVMGALVWRLHRQVTLLSSTSLKMHDELIRLGRTTDDIVDMATSTEHTLVANLAEYRLAVGNTSSYRDYLTKLGVAPAGDVEPILEAISDGAFAVSRDGRILYVNRILHDLTALSDGGTLEEAVRALRLRDLDGDPVDTPSFAGAAALRGETIHDEIVRVRPVGGTTDVVLVVNSCPARDVLGRVVAAIVVAHPVSEEVAMATAVRQRRAELDRVPATT